MAENIKEENNRDKQPFLLFLRPDLKTKLQKIAQKRGLTMTGIITQAVWDWLAEHKE